MTGLSARRPAQRIPLSPTHKDRRKQWCLEHVSWTSEWDGVLWTDESRFCLDFADGREFGEWQTSGMRRPASLSTTGMVAAQ